MSVESNRAALRKLSRKFPLGPEIDEAIDRLRNDSDLSIAITATALVEAHLENLIVAKMHSKSSALKGQIFLNRGPLSDFHSKILIAHAFGIITPAMAEELHCMKVIRNAFAHAKLRISFEHELVKREVSSFRMLNAMQRASKARGASMTERFDKGSFLLVANIILIIIDSIITRPGSADEAIRDILEEDGKARA